MQLEQNSEEEFAQWLLDIGHVKLISIMVMLKSLY